MLTISIFILVIVMKKKSAVEMFVITQAQWNNYRNKSEWEGKYTFDELKKESIWKLTDITNDSHYIPKPENGGYWIYAPKSSGMCTPNLEIDADENTQCEYKTNEEGKIVSSENYNPNKNLFQIEFIGNTDNNFFSDEENVES